MKLALILALAYAAGALWLAWEAYHAPLREDFD